MQETVRHYRSRSRYVGSRSADLSWQDRVRQYANPYGYMQEQDVRRSRITFDVELPDRAADMKPVYASGRRPASRAVDLARIRRDRDERVIPVVSRDGLRGSTALIALIALVVFLFVLWMGSVIQVWQIDAQTAKNAKSIREMNRRCQNLDIEYQNRSAKVDVLYSAVEHGMISAKGAKKIYLQVPDEVCMLPVAHLSE